MSQLRMMIARYLWKYNATLASCWRTWQELHLVVSTLHDGVRIDGQDLQQTMFVAGNTHDLDMLRESCLKKLESAAKSDSKVSSFAQKAVTVLNA